MFHIYSKDGMKLSFDFPKYYKIEIDSETGFVEIFSNSKHAKGKRLSQFKSPDGYLRVKMNNKAYQIHSIVAKYLIGERPKGLVINHKDGNKLNNAPSNLEYITIAQNIEHSIKNGMHVCNRPELMPTYIDGRTRDLKKYKHNWYLQNKEKILLKNQNKYNATKRTKNQEEETLF